VCVIISSRSTSRSVAPAKNAPKDRLEAELGREDHEQREQQERAAHPDLCARVLQSQEGVRDAPRALEPEDRRRDSRDEHHEGDEQHQLAADTAALPGKEERQQHDRRDLRNRGACDEYAPERRLRLAGVLENREDDPEAGCGEDDRDQQRRADEACRV
jgi:hypothetical protein